MIAKDRGIRISRVKYRTKTTPMRIPVVLTPDESDRRSGFSMDERSLRSACEMFRLGNDERAETERVCPGEFNTEPDHLCRIVGPYQ